jgi:hypothetical protein
MPDKPFQAHGRWITATEKRCTDLGVNSKIISILLLYTFTRYPVVLSSTAVHAVLSPTFSTYSTEHTYSTYCTDPRHLKWSSKKVSSGLVFKTANLTNPLYFLTAVMMMLGTPIVDCLFLTC